MPWPMSSPGSLREDVVRAWRRVRGVLVDGREGLASGPPGRGQLVLRNPLDGLGPDHPDTLITRNHLAYWTDVAPTVRMRIRSRDEWDKCVERGDPSLTVRKDSLRGQPHVGCRPTDPRRHPRGVRGTDHGNRGVDWRISGWTTAPTSPHTRCAAGGASP